MTDGIIFKNNFILDLYNFMFPFQLLNETTLYFGPNLTRCERNQNKFINLSYVKYRCKNLVTEVISTKKKRKSMGYSICFFFLFFFFIPFDFLVWSHLDPVPTTKQNLCHNSFVWTLLITRVLPTNIKL